MIRNHFTQVIPRIVKNMDTFSCSYSNLEFQIMSLAKLSEFWEFLD